MKICKIVALAIIAISAFPSPGAAQTFTISTIIGGSTGVPIPTYSGTTPNAGGMVMTTDSANNLLFAGVAYELLYKYSGGQVSTFTQFGQSLIGIPGGMATDSAGNLYVSDNLYNYVIKVPPNSVSIGFGTVVAGSSNVIGKFAGDNGPATSASLNRPGGLAIDSKGNLYIADSGNKRIRKISNGTITTVVGGGTTPLGPLITAAPPTSFTLSGPSYLVADAVGNLYFSDGDTSQVYQVSATTGNLTLFAGCGKRGTTCLLGDGGPATSATLYAGALAVDANGSVYIGDSNRVRMVQNGIITTVAGTGVAGSTGDGGPSTSAQINGPSSIAVDSAFRVYICEGTGIRLLTPAASINTNGIVPINSTVSTVQPSSWVSIYGQSFATTTSVWKGDFPVSLGGVSVTVDGKPAYLWFVSPTQINLQIPDDAKTGTVNVVVTTASGTATSTVTLAAQGPSFNLLDSTHVAGVILTPAGNGAYAGGTYDLVGPSGGFTYSTRPVKAGETLLLYGVGFGPTTPQVPAGQAYSGAAPTNSPVTITIGGVNAPVSFAGLAGAGLYQFNVTVPANTGKGDQPLQATINGVKTGAGPVVTIQ